MGTRGQVSKGLLGNPESVLDVKWLEARHAGEECSHIFPWDFKNRPQLPTKKQVIYKLSREGVRAFCRLEIWGFGQFRLGIL